MNTTNTNLTPPPMSDIRDIREPYVISDGSVWMWGLLALLVVAALVYWFWRRKQRGPVAPPAPPPMPPHIRAKLRLAEALTLIHDPKPFCISVSDAVRYYLEERFELRAPEQTTEEFLRELRRTDRLQPHHKESLGNFMGSCDLVKFAKYQPGEGELRALHGSAVRLVEETAPVAPETAPPPAT